MQFDGSVHELKLQWLWNSKHKQTNCEVEFSINSASHWSWNYNSVDFQEVKCGY